MVNWYRALRLSAGAKWPSIGVPVQIIWGKRDAFLNARLAEISLAQCQNGRLHYFPSATHWVQLEEGEAVNALLLSFMAEPIS